MIFRRCFHAAILTDIWRFVRAIWTVLLPIAAPAFGDTGHLVLTYKLLRAAGLWVVVSFGSWIKKRRKLMCHHEIQLWLSERNAPNLRNSIMKVNFKGEICNIFAVINHKKTTIYYQRFRKHAKLKHNTTATMSSNSIHNLCYCLPVSH